MKVIKKILQMQKVADEARCAGRKVGFVPTMGYLHKGHLSLIRQARQLSELVVVSIFVNPTQFGPHEDYQNYPRDLSRDAKLLRQVGCDILFLPSVEEMYPQGYCSYVDVENLTQLLCGASRPSHFRGVATVVTKLFNIVKPHLAVFGQKDAQQAFVIRRMVTDLNQDLEIVVAPTIREPDGLAMSSRNEYLTPQERADALVLYQALKWAHEQIVEGQRNIEYLVQGMTKMIQNKKTAQIDYISFVDTEKLHSLKRLEGEVLIALAVKFGRARLIDNLLIKV
ncbi:MAG: pantoate--beta-alanine ligase [candidate division Zixibacteria bacterium SM23_81]|nr:MAG: pantoate--beta-alanine ligase [candidate division Zixibacteria bacterium SM23_81]